LDQEENRMSRGLTYMALIASIRQRELLEEAHRERYITEVPRRRRSRMFGLSLPRALRRTR
jgi:hypothetical protein